MAYNVKELLVLPAEEKIMLADLLYTSVNEELEENKNGTEWWRDEEFVEQLNKEYDNWKNGKAKGFTIDEVKASIEEQRAKRKANEL